MTSLARSMPVFLIGCILSSSAFGSDEKEAALVTKIERFGGFVTRDEAAPGKPVTKVEITSPFTPESVIDLVAQLKTVREIHLGTLSPGRVKLLAGIPDLRILRLDNVKFRNDDLKELKNLAKLEELSFKGSTLTDQGMAHINGVKTLKKLVLYNTATSDFGIDHLKDLKNLEVIDIGMTHISYSCFVGFPEKHPEIKEIYGSNKRGEDGDFEGLHKLKSLRLLSLRNVDVRYRSCEQIGKITSLVHLDLSGCKVLDPDLLYFSKLKELRHINISNMNIGDRGIQILSSLEKLEEVHARGCPVTDDGLTHLLSLKNLRLVDLTDTQVSARAAAEFTKKRPTVKVIVSPALKGR